MKVLKFKYLLIYFIKKILAALQTSLIYINSCLEYHKGVMSVDRISYIVSNYFELHPGLIFKKTSVREVTKVRQIVHYFTRKITKLSFRVIGEKIGGVKHDTVLYSCKVVEFRMFSNKKYKRDIEKIELLLKNTKEGI